MRGLTSLFRPRSRAFLARQAVHHVVGPLVDKTRNQMLRDTKDEGIRKDLPLTIQLGKAGNEIPLDQQQPRDGRQRAGRKLEERQCNGDRVRGGGAAELLN